MSCHNLARVAWALFQHVLIEVARYVWKFKIMNRKSLVYILRN
jgi:hypothetical protein